MGMPTDLTLRRLGLAMFAVQVALEVAYLLLSRGLSDQPGLTYPVEQDTGTIVLGLAPGLVGLVLVWARPRNPIGWLVAVSGLSLMASSVGQTYGARALVLQDGLPGGTLVLSLSAPLWIPAVYISVTHLLVRYPSGTIQGRWPRRFDRLAAWAFPVLYIGYATSESSVTDVVRDEQPPVTLPETVSGALAAAGGVVLLVCAVAIVGDAVRRTWRAEARERAALLWLVGVAVLAVVLIMVGPAEWLGDVGYAAVLATIAMGVLRYQALGIELTILYGDRDDPFTALSRLGTPLGNDMDERSLGDVLEALREALDVEGVAVDGPVRAVSGTVPEQATRVPLHFAGADLGVLLIGGRAGRPALDRSGQRLVEAVAPLIAAVLHAVRVAEELREQQARVLAATQAERGRLRQELHDGLGPALTGIGLGLEALETSVPAKGDLVARLRTEVAASLEETRRIIDDLRPSALDDGDLSQALRRRAEQVRVSGIEVAVDVPDELPQLPPDLTTAVFRIAEEALTNVVRHAHAKHCRVVLRVGAELCVEVTDDGIGPGTAREGGVGLASMRERAERLGGQFAVVPVGPGTTVRATFPLGAP